MRASYRIITVFVVLLIQSCATPPGTKTKPPLIPGSEALQLEQRKETQAQEDPNTYLQQAAQASGATKDLLLLHAANIYLDRNDVDNGQKILDSIQNPDNDQNIRINRQIARAKLLLIRNEPRAALQLLSFSEILSSKQQTRVYRLRAKAFLDAGYPLEASKTLIQLNSILTDEHDREINNQAIWQTLSLLPVTTLQQLSQAPLHPDFAGWVELAIIAKRGQVDWQHLQQAIIEWQKKYPGHPAAKVFSQQLGMKQTELVERPQKIAVMLPFSGQYGPVANAIRDGFMAAYYQHPRIEDRPVLRFIDTGKNPSAIWNDYYDAINLGAQFVVGPFLKASVTSLTQTGELDVPTLTLNYSQSNDQPVKNLFEFGLLPEDEARQVADLAFHQGHQYAAVLVPQGDWGERLARAFQQRFEELGGQLITQRSYTPGANDFKRPIQSLLNINQSYARYHRLRQVTHTKMQFTPYRRQDVDMIFLAATPRDARQIKPQFKFHYAGELPVYATSHAFTGQVDSRADRDIDELYYVDMPWILDPAPEYKSMLLKLWPEEERYTRFFALGVDAYNLIPMLGRLQARSYERFSGQTGNLYIDPLNRIHRELLWAQFIRGVPTLLDINQLSETLNHVPPEQKPQQD